MHTTSKVFMVEPVNFRMNEETSTTNCFQKNASFNSDRILSEFNRLVAMLRSNGIDVHVEKDIPERDTPDSIFPNNWVSFHDDGTVFLYPMLAENRRRERNLDFVRNVVLAHESVMKSLRDYSLAETQGKILEGTGSIVFDHVNRIAYCALSERSNEELLLELCQDIRYEPVVFSATDSNNKLIYHTNVLLSIGENFAVLCQDSIRELSEREAVVKSLKNSGKKLIEISMHQMNNFCANILQLKSHDNERIIVMSQSAYTNFSNDQLSQLGEHGKLVASDITAIETWGGGSVRCMICENRL